MTTQRRCWSCGTIFTNDFGWVKCNVCLQAERLATQSDQPKLTIIQATPPPPSPPPLYTWVTEEERRIFNENYVPPSPEDILEKKRIERLDRLFALGVYSSILFMWAILWLITSGWVTLFSFIAALFVPFYLNQKHFYWQIKNAKYLYQI